MAGYFRIWRCVLFRDESCIAVSIFVFCVSGRPPAGTGEEETRHLE